MPFKKNIFNFFKKIHPIWFIIFGAMVVVIIGMPYYFNNKLATLTFLLAMLWVLIYGIFLYYYCKSRATYIINLKAKGLYKKQKKRK